MSTLGNLLREIKDDSNISLADLTVLSAENDPFRLNTPAFHEAAPPAQPSFFDVLDKVKRRGDP
jgi:hypothetical protein